MTDLAVRFLGFECATPIWTASGTFGYGTDLGDLCDLAPIGAIVTKGISPRPRPG